MQNSLYNAVDGFEYSGDPFDTTKFVFLFPHKNLDPDSLEAFSFFNRMEMAFDVYNSGFDLVFTINPRLEENNYEIGIASAVEELEFYLLSLENTEFCFCVETKDGRPHIHGVIRTNRGIKNKFRSEVVKLGICGNDSLSIRHWTNYPSYYEGTDDEKTIKLWLSYYMLKNFDIHDNEFSVSGRCFSSKNFLLLDAVTQVVVDGWYLYPIPKDYFDRLYQLEDISKFVAKNDIIIGVYEDRDESFNLDGDFNNEVLVTSEDAEILEFLKDISLKVDRIDGNTSSLAQICDFSTKPLLTVKEVASYLNISETNVRNKLVQYVKPIRMGAKLLFSHDQIDAHIERAKVRKELFFK